MKKQFKYLKDNLKKSLDSRARLTKSGAAASLLPTCQHFEQVAFLHQKTANLPTISNITPSATTPSNIMPSANNALVNAAVPSFQNNISSQQFQYSQEQGSTFSNFGLKSPNIVANESVSFPPSPASSISIPNDSKKWKKKSSSEVGSANAIIQQLYNIKSELKAPSQDECEDSLFLLKFGANT